MIGFQSISHLIHGHRIDVLSFGGIWLILAVFFLLSLQRALSRTRAHHNFEPALVWLCLIPLFGVFWQFIVVSRVTEGLRGAWLSRSGQPGDAGNDIGMTYAVLSLISHLTCCIPCVNFITSLICLIVMILYWMRVEQLSRHLESA